MPTGTYALIASNVLSSSASSVTFSSIPATYRDLIIEICTFHTGSPVQATMTVNGDSGGNYSLVYMDGASTVQTGGDATRNNFAFAYSAAASSSTRPNYSRLTIFDYSATDKHKTALQRGGTAAERVSAYAERWANTAAITSLTISATQGGDFQSGSTFYIYGIVS